ncbi:hypothetical protein DL770_004111 [Monosporascus sp. CRB-9-2]|nr:hypothetical protein DL770_004111 [Monosporascus sp. CRB-9-2]
MGNYSAESVDYKQYAAFLADFRGRSLRLCSSRTYTHFNTAQLQCLECREKNQPTKPADVKASNTNKANEAGNAVDSCESQSKDADDWVHVGTPEDEDVLVWVSILNYSSFRIQNVDNLQLL